MTNLILKLFLKMPHDPENPKFRSGCGKVAGVVGIVCNVILFLIKLLAGLLSGSVSVMADAVNNLADASSSLVTLFGFKLAEKPADSDHPYGHARIEYLSGLIVAAMILIIGVELVKSSVDKILHPEATAFSWLTVGILAASIVIKLWLSRFTGRLGKTDLRKKGLLRRLLTHCPRGSAARIFCVRCKKTERRLDIMRIA